ncbi:MAG: protein kinase domain-containing protein, partial [Myxococcaceae bacterium]
MIGGYDVVRKLSDGASAEVYLACKTDTQERVILEVLRPELARDGALRSQFIEETAARKALTHPSVARRVAGGTTDDGRLWLCTESVGESLRQRISHPGPLSVEEVLRIALPLCDGLQYLHARGMVHGNLKPASVFLEQDRAGQLRVKLVDYGLALLRTRRPFPLPSSTVLVEPEYLAPERISGNRATQRSDIYALGVLLYEALTGFPPFTSVDPNETRRKHLHDAAPPLPPSASRLASIIHKCLAKDPAHRYGSAESVRMALSGLVEGTLPLPGHSGGKVSFTLVSEGDELGSYKLEKLLGEGAMGQVYLARHSKLGRQVALKILKPQLASDRNQVQRFFQEARAVNQVSHPHIVQISDFMDEHAADGSRHVYCVMEFL